MSDYREIHREAVRETNWTFWKWFPTVAMIVVVVGILGFGARSIGLIGSTAVERAVFENSYQRSATLKSAIAQNQATITVLTEQLRNAGEEESVVLKQQILAANIRLATAKGELQ